MFHQRVEFRERQSADKVNLLAYGKKKQFRF